MGGGGFEAIKQIVQWNSRVYGLPTAEPHKICSLTSVFRHSLTTQPTNPIKFAPLRRHSHVCALR
eukprot:gene2102-13056_t